MCIDNGQMMMYYVHCRRTRKEETMGYTIKQLRVGMNMNQVQFAKFVGMNPDTYAKKEQGKRNWLAKEIIKIALACNVKVEDIILE